MITHHKFYHSGESAVSVMSHLHWWLQETSYTSCLIKSVSAAVTWLAESSLHFVAGSSAATLLIFILPAAFYLRLVKSVPLKSPQKIGVSVEKYTHNSALSHCIGLLHLSIKGADDMSCAPANTESLLVLPLSLQAAIFLVVGIVFMIGSLSLIVFDWIHNPPGSGSGH